jgi:hypothetical protein
MRAPVIIVLAALSVAACHDRRPAEGPMQYTGRKVDQGAEDTKEGVQKAGHETKEGVQKAGHETKCAAKNAKDGVQKQPRDPNCQ